MKNVALALTATTGKTSFRPCISCLRAVLAVVSEPDIRWFPPMGPNGGVDLIQHRFHFRTRRHDWQTRGPAGADDVAKLSKLVVEDITIEKQQGTQRLVLR